MEPSVLIQFIIDNENVFVRDYCDILIRKDMITVRELDKEENTISEQVFDIVQSEVAGFITPRQIAVL